VSSHVASPLEDVASREPLEKNRCSDDLEVLLVNAALNARYSVEAGVATRDRRVDK
jgi:hypothetical protein